jgi:hypothetical protein
MTHSASSVEIKFNSNMAGINKYWGIRDFNVTIELCSKNCDQCKSAYKCIKCATSYVLGSNGFC